MITRPVLLLLLVASAAQAQPKPVATVELGSPIAFASVDRPGDFYVGLGNGELRKFDKNGKQLGALQAPPLTLFEAGDGTKSFGFIRQSQQVLSIAYDLRAFQSTAVHPEFAVNPWLVCPSRSEQWILDSADVSLKKTRGNITSIAFESSWTSRPTSVTDIVYMREYLNFLFILERGKGIHIINSLGKEVRRIADADITGFNFLGEELYYVKGSKLVLTDLYTTETREIGLPAPANYVFLTDDRMAVVTGTTLSLYPFTP